MKHFPASVSINGALIQQGEHSSVDRSVPGGSPTPMVGPTLAGDTRTHNPCESMHPCIAICQKRPPRQCLLLSALSIVAGLML